MTSEEVGDFCSGISCSLVTYALVNNPTTMCIQASLIGLRGGIKILQTEENMKVEGVTQGEVRMDMFKIYCLPA